MTSTSMATLEQRHLSSPQRRDAMKSSKE